MNSPERVLWDAMNTESSYEYLKENVIKTIGEQKSLKILAFTVDGSPNDEKTVYTRTYDGEIHEVLVNTSECANVRLTPSQLAYLETENSEYLNDATKDYRDKKTVSTSTDYKSFTLAEGSARDASTYSITYTPSDKKIATMKILRRSVQITGLKAKNKTYDAWQDAPIDYSDMQIYCTNDGENHTGIAESDQAVLGTKIVPYAKAFFLREAKTGEEAVCTIDGKGYVKDENVAYVNGAVENGVVDTKKVFIREIFLSDPNYYVIQHDAEESASQSVSEAKIFPRNLTDEEHISCYVNPTEFSWTKDYKWKNVEKKVFDTSSATPKTPLAQPVELVAGTDYTLSHNSYNEVGRQTVKFTGRANYVGSITADWTIYKAVRQITINENKKRVYDKTAYPVTVSGAAFNYKIMDVSNNDNVTQELEAGSDLSITYKGRGTTVYAESENAPVDAGDYTVTIAVKETAHYTAAETSLDFTIAKKPVTLEWTCSDRENGTGLSRMTYNGKPNVFTAKATNVIEGDSVNVTRVVYNGTTTGNVKYTDSADAPKEAGAFVVKAVEVDNPNYTTNGSNTHSYTVDRAVVTLKWEKTGEQVYNAKDLTPVPVVQDLLEQDVCKVNGWAYTGTDVYGNAYTAATRAYNVSKGNITVKATALDNPNYILTTDAENTKAVFHIVPFDLGTLKSPEELFAHKIDYSGYQVAPELEWKKDGCGEILKRNRDYTSEDFSEASEPAEQDMRIVIEGKNNYKGTNEILWNIDKLASSITITNYQKNGENPFAVTYGEKLPALTFTYENRDVEKDFNHTLESAYLEYTYTGTMANGKAYEKTSKVQTEAEPSQAGTYKVTVKLIETDHYLESTAEADFVIRPKSIVIKAGVKGVDKHYDGTTQAALDFTEVELEGIEDADADTIAGLFAKAEKDYVSYEAAFAQKDVLYKETSETGREVTDIAVSFENPALILKKGTPDVFFNYVIAAEGNQTETAAQILPKTVKALGVKAKNKVYDGTVEVALDTAGLSFDGVVKGESLTADVRGAFIVSGQEPEAEDVLTDESGAAAAKKVTLTFENLQSVSENTLIGNYSLSEDANQKETTAVISPATLTVTGVKAANKDYDNTNEAKGIDWTKAEIGGVMEGDIVTLSENNAYPETGTYADEKVAYDVNGDVTDKIVNIGEFVPELSGSFWKENYKIGKITVTGRIYPVKLKELVWTLDEETKLPKAAFAEDSGRVEGDDSACSILTGIFAEEDTTFQNPLSEDELKEDHTYVVKVLGLGNGNYTLSGDAEATYTFVHDLLENTKEESEVQITNYKWTAEGAYSITYGEELPKVTFSYENGDLTDETADEFISVSYNGTMKNGGQYAGNEAPTQAGTYRITVTLAETEHYLSSTAKASFKILPKIFRIKAGIKAVDKVYNATTKAALDLKGITFDGILDADREEINALFAQNEKDHLHYTAEFAQKDVLWKYAKAGRTVEDIAVTVSDFGLVYNVDTPDVLYNYELDGQSGPKELKAKILPKSVTVSGITALDKNYDATDSVKLDTKDMELSGRMHGERLSVSVNGIFIVTGNEEKAAEVLLNEEGKEQPKKVAITYGGLYSVSENTVSGNYILAEEGQQKETTAVIRQAKIKKVLWSFDEKAQLPVAAIDETCGIVKGSEDICEPIVRYYAKEDTEFATPLTAEECKEDERYIARVEGVDNTNYALSGSFKNPVYTFISDREEEKAPEPEKKPAITQEDKDAAVLALNSGISIKLKKKQLQVKWGRVTGADGYFVYIAERNKPFGTARMIEGNRTSFSITRTKQNKVFKAYVTAYKIVDGKKEILGSSREVSYAGSKIKNYNAKKLNVKEKTVTLNVNGTKTLNASVVLTNGKKKTGKKAKLQYWSTSPAVATVSATGQITGCKKGTAVIYIMTRSGKKKTVKVTVI